MAKNDMANATTGIESAAIIEATVRNKAQKVIYKVGECPDWKTLRGVNTFRNWCK